ncbi:DNA recombination protein RmuC [Vibrio sp. MACH09]|uniref:DNA recombination protein RmuC n=1 Tax=unclassified Vibrio TaxID=2614977 RepID=UPI001493469C|nr:MULTISPECIES: DNA recombination protein RmuC [unclassified Vibrio]NOI68514.1 DNA recombination protein RmuC [Vibrio sp. 99-8-1]GLO59527.1 DNA recombination protein RmuC [Vibrio sp. MACH09]
MQWIIEHQNMVLAVVVSGICSAFFVGWWCKQKMMFQLQLRAQEQATDTLILNEKNAQLQQALDYARDELDKLDIERDKSVIELKQLHGKLMAAMEKQRHFDEISHHRNELTAQLDQQKGQCAQLQTALREQEARREEENKANREKLQLLEQAEQRLKQEFEQLASALFDVKTAKVDEQNKQSLQSLLSPLKEQLEGFKKQVNDNFGAEAKERHTLVYEIKNLQKLNEQMTKDAVNLTKALKGDNKQQGNWGEVVLARVLAESGLREGHEYQTQVSLQNDAGKRYQPDVIVHLPHDRQVVIDSKMALIAYERFFNATNDEDKSSAIRDHLLALRAHIKGLSQKDYHQLKGIQSLDYVLMFIPVEPAFQVAAEADPSLIKDAMENNIILVSPTTLLVALRTIDNLWRNERQNQHAKVIAEKASKLYDKLRLFLTDMEQVGHSIDKANLSYQGAMNKLATGRGNVIRQAESFKALGVEIKRPIPQSISEIAQNDVLVERQQPEDKVN